jgi:hypothetical protein
MKKKFKYEFEDTSKYDSIRFEYSDKYDEKINIEMMNGVPALSANKSGFMHLAKLCLKMALSDYKDGFYFDIKKDLDDEQKEIILISLDNR